MFTPIFNEITGRLDSRFTLTLFLPSLIFWGGMGIIFVVAHDFDSTLKHWQSQDDGIKIIAIIIALSWVTFFAYLLSNQLVWLTKQFEGYWEWLPFIGNKMINLKKSQYQKMLMKLNRVGNYELIYHSFPLPNEEIHVMPTRFGNIMKNAELYPYQRYEIDAVLLWPRLYPILPEAFVKMLDNAKTSLDFMMIVSTLSALIAVLGGAYLFSVQIMPGFALCILGGFTMSYLAYRSMLEAAVTYGQLLKSAFDLYKDALRKQLGYLKPSSLKEERDLWKAINELLYRGETNNLVALHYEIERE